MRAKLSKSLPQLLALRRRMLATRRQALAFFRTEQPPEAVHDQMGEALRDEFEYLWKNGDPWDLEGSEYEQKKYLRQFALLDHRRYQYALEVGSGNACFSRFLSRIADKVLALDISESAIARARTVSVRRFRQH
jgi:SAM-dependent methyltransferase